MFGGMRAASAPSNRSIYGANSILSIHDYYWYHTDLQAVPTREVQPGECSRSVTGSVGVSDNRLVPNKYGNLNGMSY